MRVAFTHTLDSHNAFESVDCGTFVSLSNGDDLETGSMPRPDLPGNPLTDYEEVWRELPFRLGPEGPNKGISWVLESDTSVPDNQEGIHKVTKTFLGRVWGTFLALRQEQTIVSSKDPSGNWISNKSGSEVAAKREEWDSGWVNRYNVGNENATLPSIQAGLEGEAIGSWRVVGDKVSVGGEQYIVRAFEELR